MTSRGKIEFSKTHRFHDQIRHFKISHHLQELICLVGQKEVFEEAEETFKELMQLEISAKQIQRVSESYGKKAGKLITINYTPLIPELARKNKEDATYVMVDGSMVLTREKEEEKPWREMKLARIFNASQVIDIQAKRNEIINGLYVSHLGSNKVFTQMVEYHLIHYKKLVFIADGAVWIWNWIESNYPGSIQILDFYHAAEKLILFAKHHIRKEEKRTHWIEKQKELLINNEVIQVIENIQSLYSKNKEAKQIKNQVIEYYTTHEDRMQYKTFREKGYLIGSGPIEAAHRSVIQQRLKLSGQRWSVEGANGIATLRCIKKSNVWQNIINLIRGRAA